MIGKSHIFVADGEIRIEFDRSFDLLPPAFS